MSSPHLPPELEHEIFLLAFQSEGAEVNNLCLVAKRVLDWLIPQIYHLVIISSEKSSPINFNEIVYKKYGHHVRHLFLEDDELGGCLHLFPNVINLAFWVASDPADVHLPALLQLPLTCISTNPSPELFQLFANVTHLDFLSGFDSESMDIKSVLYLPKLTHVCVVSESSLRLFLERERCPQLKMGIVWGWGEADPKLDERTLSDVDDSRVMMIRCEPRGDWEIGAKGGVDMWRFAEGILASRNGSG
ncbi:hypothetical protein BDN72DRAFT_843828 [Pluteus cervinus]|uniref:Uncharacterized protein n=1 Tax=Pluteus cervinus TaxID=181527 RepID=A0ACD3ANB5_9AGAR|nr:hypothetical protein BDN72DRAFT_843828 [Pluteus cervinus]